MFVTSIVMPSTVIEPVVMFEALRFVTVMFEASIVPAVNLFADTPMICASDMAASFTTPFSIQALFTLARFI